MRLFLLEYTLCGTDIPTHKGKQKFPTVTNINSSLRLGAWVRMLTLRFPENYIDGAEFVGLSEAEIKEIIPPIGLTKKIMKLIPKVVE